LLLSSVPLHHLELTIRRVMGPQSTELMLRPLSALHAPDTEGAIRVMTFNCRYDTPSDDKNRWAYRKESFIRAIREQQPDFLGIQEALHHQLQDIRQGLPW